MLESNTKENRIIFVLERLDKDRLYNQFNDLKVGFNCSFHDSELGKILKPSDIELSDFVKGMTEKYYHRVEARLSCHNTMNINISIPQMVIYRNFVISTITISTMEIVLNIGRILNFNRMMELLNQSTVSSTRVLL